MLDNAILIPTISVHTALFLIQLKPADEIERSLGYVAVVFICPFTTLSVVTSVTTLPSVFEKAHLILATSTRMTQSMGDVRLLLTQHSLLDIIVKGSIKRVEVNCQGIAFFEGENREPVECLLNDCNVGIWLD